MTLQERGQRLFHLMQEAGALVAAEPVQEHRDELWARGSDWFHDAVSTFDGVLDPERLRESLTDLARREWYSDNTLHSVRAPLRLVTEDEFAEMAYGPREAS